MQCFLFIFFTWKKKLKNKISILYLKIWLFTSKPSQAEEEDESQKGINKATKGGIIYGEYLQVMKSPAAKWLNHSKKSWNALRFYNFNLFAFSLTRCWTLKFCRVNRKVTKSTMSIFSLLPTKVINLCAFIPYENFSSHITSSKTFCSSRVHFHNSWLSSCVFSFSLRVVV